MSTFPNILVTGATGFIGSALIGSLAQKGNLFALVRNARRQVSTAVDTITYLTLQDIEEGNYYFDTIINLAGENIAGGRWSNHRKQRLLDSRVKLTNQLYHALEKKPKQLISMSAIGIYGHNRHQSHDETHSSTDGFAAQLCSAWEQEALNFENAGTRVCIIRLGVVLGHGGALKQMLPAFKLGLGGKIASGQQWFPWIHLEDVIRLILFLLNNNQYQGIFNGVSPTPITQAEFAQTLAKTLHRPCFLTTPRWLLDLVFGEMASLLTEGVKVHPKRTITAGFQFQHKDLSQALVHIFNAKRK